VLLVKLADRLHNMRTLHHIKDPNRRRRIARETMDLYAPLASRIGMERVKRDLEELAFTELNPDGRSSVQARLGYLREKGDKLVPEVEAELIKTLKDGGLVADVSGREKTPYSIWRKMQQKNVSFEQLADIMAFRIIVADVAQNTSLFVEIGGGIRDMETVETYLSAGVSRVILGTAAVNNEAFLREAVAKYGERIAVGADVKDGYIAIKGWMEQSAYTLEAFMEKMQSIGVSTIICTDISKDGAMIGTNRELYRDLSRQFSMDIVASGGVSTMEDVTALTRMGLYGAIIGKAYYTGAIDLAAAIKEAQA
jgi:phosphoribosylformimino-5-aminoimidazole carboxamide ribotide isomerase